MDTDNMEYAGFWIRVGASLIDTLLLGLIIWPVLTMIYGESYWLSTAAVKGVWDLVFSYMLPAAAIVAFWFYKSATPGKMALSLTIVDADTGGKPSTGQLVGRYLAYYLSLLPFCMGFIWIGIDPRKQGWHDKLARTVVVRDMTKQRVEFG